MPKIVIIKLYFSPNLLHLNIQQPQKMVGSQTFKWLNNAACHYLNGRGGVGAGAGEGAAEEGEMSRRSMGQSRRSMGRCRRNMGRCRRIVDSGRRSMGSSRRSSGIE